MIELAQELVAWLDAEQLLLEPEETIESILTHYLESVMEQTQQTADQDRDECDKSGKF